MKPLHYSCVVLEVFMGSFSSLEIRPAQDQLGQIIFCLFSQVVGLLGPVLLPQVLDRCVNLFYTQEVITDGENELFEVTWRAERGVK